MAQENLQLKTSSLLCVLRESPMHFLIHFTDCISVAYLEFAKILILESESFLELSYSLFCLPPFSTFLELSELSI